MQRRDAFSINYTGGKWKPRAVSFTSAPDTFLRCWLWLWMTSDRLFACKIKCKKLRYMYIPKPTPLGPPVATASVSVFATECESNRLAFARIYCFNLI